MTDDAAPGPWFHGRDPPADPPLEPSVTSLVSRTTSLLAAVAVLGAGALLLAGCSSASEGTAEPRATTTAGTLDAGFWDASRPPAPESTVSPSPGSWKGVHPPSGYRVVLLSAGDVDADGDGETAASAPTQALVGAVDAWADTEGVTLTRVQPRGSENVLDAVATAVGKHPDLVISVGNDMVDPIAAMSPSALHQQFLVLGAEIAEPTSNVTAADWTGAGYRGEGLGTASHHDPASFTEERAGRALRAGVAAVLHGYNGTVVWVA
jgi:hypothetical protein